MDNLDEWLGALEAGQHDKTRLREIPTWSFPTDRLRDEFFSSIDGREDRQVRLLLEYFLFDQETFGADLRDLPRVRGAAEPSEYIRRLGRVARGTGAAHPGVRWTLDLLPYSPRSAMAVIDGYLLAHAQQLPDGRISGLQDAIDLIRVAYVEQIPGPALEVLRNITPRDFEKMTASLYSRLGYDVELTAAARDGGRDVIADRKEAGQHVRLLIECKHFMGSVGVRYARALLGVVSDGRAGGGVLVTSGSVTRGVKDLSESNARFSYVEGSMLVTMMNSEFGANWFTRMDRLTRPW